MSFSDYTGLQGEIADWLNRSDLTSKVPQFIQLGQAKINLVSRLLQQEERAAVTLTSGLDYASLPTGFLDLIDFYYDADKFAPADYLTKTLPKSTATGRPQAFAVSKRIQFDRTADATYALTMPYFKAWDIAGDTTNWLLTNYPNGYLYTALAEAEAYLTNDERVPGWVANAASFLKGLETQSARVRGKAPLRADCGLLGGTRYNVYQG